MCVCVILRPAWRQEIVLIVREMKPSKTEILQEIDNDAAIHNNDV